MPLALLFLPMVPAYVALWWWDVGSTPLWSVVLVVTVFPVLIVALLRARARKRNVYRNGHVAMGHVVRAYKRNNAVRSNMTVIVQYVVNGVAYEGAFNVRLGLPTPPAGTPFWILHDPTHPANNAVVGVESY